MAALSHSTRRVLIAAGKIPARSSYPQHESDVTYTPLADRAWDADSETMQPRRAPVIE